MTDDELLVRLTTRFRAKYPNVLDRPQRLEVTQAEEEAYRAFIVRKRGWPPLAVANDAGEIGLAFKGVPLIVVETELHSGAPVGCTVNAPEKNTICVEPLTTRNS